MIMFYDANAEDPNWKIRQCYTLLIAGASEMENGVDNLWKKGAASGRRNHPYFGQYLGKNIFKCFKLVARFFWADEEHWFTDHCCLDKFNQQRKNLVRTLILVLDESMSG
jgi:hypothetical protein